MSSTGWRSARRSIAPSEDDDIDALASKFVYRRGQAVQIIVLDEIDRQIAAFNIAQLAQPILKGEVRRV